MNPKQVVITLNVEVSDPDIEIIVKVERVVNVKVKNYKYKPPDTKIPLLDPNPFIDAVCEVTGLEKEGILSKGREVPFVHARQMLYAVLKENKYNLKQCGAAAGGRDHTTAMWGLNKHENDMKYVESYRETFEKLMEKLKTKQ